MKHKYKSLLLRYEIDSKLVSMNSKLTKHDWRSGLNPIEEIEIAELEARLKTVTAARKELVATRMRIKKRAWMRSRDQEKIA